MIKLLAFFMLLSLLIVPAINTGTDGRVLPVVIEAESNIQDGVLIHSFGGTSVRKGPKASIAHGVIVHGPCEIGKGCFLTLRAVLYSTTLEDNVWVGIGAIIMRATIPSHTMVPAGSMIRSKEDTRHFRIIDDKEKSYQNNVLAAANMLWQ